MALPLIATPDQLGARVGQTLTDDPRAASLLWGASVRVRAYTRQQWVRVDQNDATRLVLDPNVPDPVVEVVLAVAERAYRNPDGGRTTAQAGTFGITTGPSGSADAGLYLTKQDREILDGFTAPDPDAQTPFSGLGVIGTTKGEPVDPTGYVPVAPGRTGDPEHGYPTPVGNPFPWGGDYL